MEQINILCYGDSNTWGTIGRWSVDGKPSECFDAEHRWPEVMQAALGDRFHIIRQGLGGRTTIYDEDGCNWKNGEMYLKPCLFSHRPLNLVIIMLGSNDLLVKQDITAEELPLGISRLVDIVQAYPKVGAGNVPPKVLILAPIPIREPDPRGRVEVYEKYRREIGEALSRQFAPVYQKVAEEKGCYFMDAGLYAEACDADGDHFTPESHVRLGHALAEYIRKNIYPEV